MTVRESLHHARERHVRPLPRAVSVEIAQDDRVEIEAARIGTGEVLAGELRDSVRRDRPGRHVLRGRIAPGLAVDRGRRREDDPHAPLRSGLEDALARQDVPAHVKREDVPEAAHARLAGEVEYTVEAAEVELVLGEIEPAHVQAARVPLLDRRVVVIGEAVDPDDLVPGRRECFREMGTDEARSSGHHVLHRSTIPYIRAWPTTKSRSRSATTPPYFPSLNVQRSFPVRASRANVLSSNVEK